ncbi:hypothetical protein [Actibacterium lipolyticum]|uniref:MOSC domain-containing protein n=1 Tax=Actibacterium lipolyticum TaxID=1524263 RepID=A0A238JJX3_9RHOB|nr:hypothetical protein [Actibacterium lipolyticum]SMX30785.1 hypothetical protein COL8621_00119 [Actibacterium lipolyticum]
MPFHPTRDELMAALPHILDAPKDNAPIDILCFRPGYSERTYPDQIELCPDRGIIGERWANHAWLRNPDGSGHPGIQVSILGARVFKAAVGGTAGNIHPGDTIIADLDTTQSNMPTGTRLQIGTAVLRVSEVFNDGCVKWRKRNGDAAKDWLVEPEHVPLRLRGLLCAVEQAGVIRKDDVIRKA